MVTLGIIFFSREPVYERTIAARYAFFYSSEAVYLFGELVPSCA